jgi:1-pyrroline-4-hydroxy-2-carboxylate deaminase
MGRMPGHVKEEAAPIPARILALSAAKPPIRRIFSAHGGYGWVYEGRLGAEGLITERAAFADVLTRIWKLQQSGSDPVALQDVYARFILVANLAKDLPGGDFRGFQFYLWQKRGVPMAMVSRNYGPKATISPSPIVSELKLTKEEVAEIEYCFEGLKPYLKQGSPGPDPR